MSMKVDGNGASSFAGMENSSSVSTSSKNVSPDKIRNFEKYMQDDNSNDPEPNSQQQQGKGDNKNTAKNQPDLSSMLASLNLSTQPASPTSQLAETPVTTSPDELLNLSQTLTDKILVSTNRLDGAHQVMLNLNSDILPNTSITLTRDINGMLFVNIVSADPNVYKKLMETQEFLKESLDQHEVNSFRIEISYDGAPDDEYANLRRPIDRFNNLDDE